MIPDSRSVQQAIENARQALQRGDRQAARRWAEQAIALAPKTEDAWLLLAAVSSPRAAVACMEQALQINPGSERARRGMAWALEQVRRQESARGDTQPRKTPTAPSPSVPPPSPPPVPAAAFPAAAAPRPSAPSPPRKKTRRPAILWALLTLTILCAAALWTFWPGRAAPAPALWLNTPQPTATPTLPGAPANFVKATLTPSPTDLLTSPSTPTLLVPPSPTATASPTPAPTSTASPSPSPSETPLPSPEAFTETPAVAGLVYVTPDTPAPVVSSYSPAGGERWIDIDLSEQRLYAYEGDTVVASFVVSTGTAQYPTVTGQFRIYVKYVSTTMSGPGYYLPNVPYTMYFYRGYGIHGTYWHNNFGTPMSHGCVNMRTSDAAWLFDWASVGTLVVVHP